MPLTSPRSQQESTSAAPDPHTSDPQHPLAGLDLAPYAFTRRCWVDATPDSLYRLISDVALIETWSPSAKAVSYAPGDGPWVGARFSGRNSRDGREWVTHSEVVQADPGTEFAFVVGGADDGIVRWSWHFSAQGSGSIAQQSWQLLRTDPVLGDTREDLQALRDHMADSAESTLVALAEWVTGHAGP
ncbi:SRPBCC family protein [Streptomyces sp. NPDC048565]|uniref:SRPBCC family protein n=1 Tax=Streptomyces sp. NPDC048565 TaxID=3155266 RepID=UPI0034224FBD